MKFRIIVFCVLVIISGCKSLKEKRILIHEHKAYTKYHELDSIFASQFESRIESELLGSTVDLVDAYWQISKDYPGTKSAEKATIRSFEILHIARDYNKMADLFSEVSIEENSMEFLISYIPYIIKGTSDDYIAEWRRIINYSGNLRVKASALLHIANETYRRGDISTAKMLVDSLKNTYPKFSNDSLYIEKIKEIDQNLTSYCIDSTSSIDMVREANQIFKNAIFEHRSELAQMFTYRALIRKDYLNIPDSVSQYSLNSVGAPYLSNNPIARKNKTVGILFYYYEDSFLYSFLIKSDGLEAVSKIKISKDGLFNAVNNLRKSLGLDIIQSYRSPRVKYTDHSKTANYLLTGINDAVKDLSNILFQPTISKRLRYIDYMTIIPTLNLGAVPFALLQPYDNDTCLIDLISFSISPSLYDFIKPNIHGHVFNPDSWAWENLVKNPLVVGDPEILIDDNWFFPPLPGAREEAKRVSNILNATPLIGENATKDKILHQAKKASIIYLATHAVADENNPLDSSFIALAGDSLSNGRWTLYEIQSTPLKASLVVLSACQTGLGQVHDAGILGVARGFQVSGVQRVVVSLWDVNDQATIALMSSFIEHLKNEYPVDALRMAMIERRNIDPDPLNWASFTLFGTLW